MQSNTRTNQGGSVINFLIVGVILAAIALGAIFFASQRGKAPTDEPVKTPATTSPAQTASPSPSVQAPSSSPRPSATPSQVPAMSPSPNAVPHTGVMPETGPSEVSLISLLPLGLVAAFMTAYLRSRRVTP